MDKIKIFIADDSLVARSMLIRLLSSESNIEIAGETGTGQGSIIMLEEIDPDIVMLEANIGGGMDIKDVVRELKMIKPDVKIILCADHNAESYMMQATNAGADDFVMKPYKKNNILRAIRDAMEHQ